MGVIINLSIFNGVEWAYLGMVLIGRDTNKNWFEICRDDRIRDLIY